MALINDIIKKYENQANQAAMQRMGAEYSANRDDIFLKVEKRGDETGAIKSAGLGTGSIWKAQKVGLNAPARVLTPAELQAQKSPMEIEIENLRKENTELKQKLAEVQVNYA